MKPASVPIAIPPDIAAKCSGDEQFEKFDRLFRSVIAVPKAAVEKEETRWKKAQAKKKAKNGSR